jgi:CarboxypepD_reg-like domain/Carboxypeptidase regulatory-like domain
MSASTVRAHLVTSAALRAGRIALLVGAACVAGAWMTGKARPSHSQGVAGYGVVAGIVADSLYGGPLVGAQISIEGINSEVISDSLGRFRLDSVPPGRYRIGIFHPLLDSLGMSLASPPLNVAADSTLSLVFSTPSAGTIIRMDCGAAPPETGDSATSLIIGRVLDAETDAPIAGAHVSLRWNHLQSALSAKLHRAEAQWDTTTGSSGEFRFCHVPAHFAGVARASRSAADTFGVSRPYLMRGRLVRFLALHIPAADSGPQAARATSGPATLTGRVIRAGQGDDRGSPFIGAVVTVDGARDTAFTGDSGQFTLRRLPTGSRTLEVRALGWEPETFPIELSSRTARNVIVPLTAKTTILDAVVVTATLNAGLHRIGFDARKRLGVGHFLGPEDIAKATAFEFADLMTTMPGIKRRFDQQGNAFLAPTRGTVGCVSYIVDGMPFLEATPGQINHVVPVSEIGAVEVYQASEAPPGAQYTSPPAPGGQSLQRAGQLVVGSMDSLSENGGTECVKIYIWTKTHLGL